MNRDVFDRLTRLETSHQQFKDVPQRLARLEGKVEMILEELRDIKGRLDGKNGSIQVRLPVRDKAGGLAAVVSAVVATLVLLGRSVGWW